MSGNGFKRYVFGGETERLDYEREHAGQCYEHLRVYEPWSIEETRSLRNIARQLLVGDEWHRSGDCRRGEPWERQSCSTCALHGYEPPDGWGDGYSVKESGPNYAGWQRIYVQASHPVPGEWAQAFAHRSDNEKYEEALGRDIATFGHPGLFFK